MKKEKLKHIAKRITAFAAAVAMAAAFTFPTEVGDGIFEGFGSAIVASAETYTNQYDISAGNVTIDSDGTYRIYSNDPNTSVTNTITVAAGVSADITLDNVTIDVSRTYNTCAFKIEDNSTGNVTIDLVGENTLKSGGNCAGLQKNGSGTYTSTLGKLTIKSTSGTGKLTANGGSDGAGIGGGQSRYGSNITISGGTVIANGGSDGAGIGGGSYCFGMNITISGGTVTATGGYGGAGIGGGIGGSGSYIEISGGTVTANGGTRGAGIGGGEYGSGSYITISGGTVTANGGVMGAGIGGGYSMAHAVSSGSYITISGGSVYAKGGVITYNNITSYGADIGGGVTMNSNRNFSDGVPVTPTNGTTDVYLREIENSTGAAITVNGKSYPTSHNGGTTIYAYLPEKSLSDPNKVKVGNTATYCYYDTASSMWIDVNSITEYTITATAGANGSISPSGAVSVEEGDDQTFTITPDSGYDIDTLTVDGSTVTAAASYTFENVTEDHTISVTFKSIQKDLTVTGGTEGTDYTYENGVLTIKTAVPITVSGTTTRDQIVVESGVSANITLDNVNIDVSGTEYACAFKIEDDSTGNVTIDLVGENTLKSGNYCAGLQKSGSNGSLEIKGTGKLTAIGGYCGAGIGGSKHRSAEKITISSGTVTATGGKGGAGIGGGYYCPGSDITISGGTVFATGGEDGAGIGGGNGLDGGDGTGSNITISGGTVTANGGKGGAGIGGGVWGSGSNISISDSIVTAEGGDNGAGIGGGIYGSGSNITITDSNVTATGGILGAGIGGGIDGFGSDITITESTVTAKGSDGGAGIGGGIEGTCSDIIIKGGSVYANGGVHPDDSNVKGADIGGGIFIDQYNDVFISGVTVIPTNGTVDVYLRETENPEGADITINDEPYPTNHNGEKKIYAYLPAKSPTNPNEVIVGNTTTYCYYDIPNSVWVNVNIVVTHTITATAGAGGSISPSGTVRVASNDSKTFTITPDNGYEIDTLTVDNAVVTSATSYTFENVTEDHTISVTFKQANTTYLLTVTNGSGSGSYEEGASVTIRANTIAGNPFKEWIGLDGLTLESGSASTESVTFKMPARAVSVEATYNEDIPAVTPTYTLTVTNGSGSGSYEEGALVTITANTIAGKVFKEWTVISGNVTIADSTSSTATFTMPASDVEVAATYEDIPAVTHTITATAGAGGSISPSGSVTVADKGSKTFTITPDSGYEIDTLTVDNAVVTSAASYTFANVTEDHTISVTFKLKQSHTNKYDIIVIGNAYADKSFAAAGEIVNVRSDFGYDIIVTAANGQRIAQITEKGSFVMPASKVYVKAVQNETFALMATAWRNSYVYSYDVDMNKIKVNSTKKRGVIVVNLGEEYAGKSFTIYEGKKSTKVKVTEGKLDSNRRFKFEVPDGKNYTLVVED